MNIDAFSPTPTVVDQIVPWPLKNRPFVFWILLFIVAMIATTIVSKTLYDARAFLNYCIAYGVGILTVPLAFRFSYLKFARWIENVKAFVIPENKTKESSDIGAWVQEEFRFFGRSKSIYTAGFCFTVIAIAAFNAGDYPIGFVTASQICALCVLSISACLAGFGLYAIFGGARMIWRLGRFQVQVKPHKFGILSTGRVIADCYFAIGLTWSIYVVGAFVGLNHFDLSFRAAKYPLLALAAPSFAIGVILFVACQIPLHNRMLEFKRNELFQIEGKLDNLNELVNAGISPENRADLEFFENRRAQILALPEWPFDFRTLLAAIGSTATVMVPTLITSSIAAVARAAGFPLH